MLRRRWIILGLMTAAVVGLYVSAQDTPKPSVSVDLQPLITAYRNGFQAHDAAALANLWTAEAELTTADGEKVRGRAAIRARYAELFQARPNLKVEVVTGEIRSLGDTAAVVEGVLTITLPDDPEPDVTIFRAWVAKEADGWRLATVESYEADPEPPAVGELEWLVGDWTGKGEDGSDIKVSYTWLDGKKFLRGEYTATNNGQSTGGIQIIGNSAGELRGWVFDRVGTVAESEWAKDGNRWLVQSVGTLSDGGTSEVTNVLVKISDDAFTFQSVDRITNGEPEPDSRPVKLTRTTK